MERIDLLLACMPRFLADILSEHIGGQPDMHILGKLEDCDELAGEIGRLSPDVVVLGTHSRDLPESHAALLRSAPDLKVITIERDGQRATLYELRPSRTLVADLSVESFLNLIRSAVEPGKSAPARVVPAGISDETGPPNEPSSGGP